LETKLSGNIEIGVAPEKVFAFITSDKLNDAIKDFGEGKWTTAGPVGVGSTLHYVGAGRNKGAAWDNKITEFVENKKMTMHSVGTSKRALDSIQTWALEPTTKGTKLTLSVDYDMPYSVLGKLADELVFSRALKKQGIKMLENIRKALEG
jgi:hypothetical protein